MRDVENHAGPTRIAIIGSTNGSVFSTAYAESESVRQSSKVIMSDRECPLVTFARSQGIPTVVCDGLGSERTSDRFLEEVRAYGVDLTISFYTRLFRGGILQELYGRFVNFHPSLLPAHPGMRGFEETIENGDLMLGASVHLVDYGVDTGPIVMRSEARNATNLPVAVRRHLVFRMQVAQLMQLCEVGPDLALQASSKRI